MTPATQHNPYRLIHDEDLGVITLDRTTVFWVRAWMAVGKPTVVLVCPGPVAEGRQPIPTYWWTTKIAHNVFRRLLRRDDACCRTRYYQWSYDEVGGVLQRVRFAWAGPDARRLPTKSVPVVSSWDEFEDEGVGPVWPVKYEHEEET